MRNSIVYRGQFIACLLVFLSAMFSLSSCQKQDLSDDANHVSPVLRIGEGLPHLDENPPCQGTIAFDLEFVMDRTADYDVAIEILAPINPSIGLPTLQNGCLCSKVTYCIEFAYTQSDFHRVGVKKKTPLNSPVQDIYVAPQSGPGQGNANANANANANSNANSNANANANSGLTTPGSNFVVCVDLFENGNIILVDFPGDLPPNTTVADLIVSAGGLCIVDNIPDPNG